MQHITRVELFDQDPALGEVLDIRKGSQEVGSLEMAPHSSTFEGPGMNPGPRRHSRSWARCQVVRRSKMLWTSEAWKRAT
jgi:hypothetical protein